MVVQVVVNRSVAKAFQSSALQSAVERAVHISPAVRHIANDMATRTTDLLVFKETVFKSAKNKLESRSHGNAEVNRYLNVSNRSVVHHKTRTKDELSPCEMDLVRSASPATSISDDKKMNLKAYSNSTSLDES